MTEPSIRELLSRAVEAGPPPGIQLPVDDVLARNRQLLRRRRIGQTVAAAVLVTVAAGIATLLPGWPRSALPTAPAAPLPNAATPMVTATPPATGPPPDYRALALAAMDRLTAAIPAGYTLPQGDSTPAPGGGTYATRETTWHSATRASTNEQKPKELYRASLEVQLDGRAAVLTLRLLPAQTPSGGVSANPCDTPINSEEQTCRMVTAGNGSAVRIASWHPVTGPVDEAVYITKNLLVTVQQAGRPRPGVYALGRPVLPDQQLADLVTDPALLP
ncbi:hypothetical protein BDK92_4105 [Micromonospora pisi]|uniref:Uncharacterized protein n=1 Tax=Micromonospora pisi TaxID=589240 RepID=A0A495JNY2_9ACTN|nr:hypothetical protein [Micromonospora pisi]RKR89749.1 hypothetical protein BDK92_4105 [Micromonospora pisi]